MTKVKTDNQAEKPNEQGELTNDELDSVSGGFWAELFGAGGALTSPLDFQFQASASKHIGLLSD